MESGKAWFLDVDSDQELTFFSDLAAITLTSGLKNIGNSLIWFFDQWDAGEDLFGQNILLGIPEGDVGLVTNKNFTIYASGKTKDAVEATQQSIIDGSITVLSPLTTMTGPLPCASPSFRKLPAFCKEGAFAPSLPLPPRRLGGGAPFPGRVGGTQSRRGLP